MYLIDSVSWERFPISQEGSREHVDLTLGIVGNNKPVGLVIAGVHGDEGPWGAFAIQRFLEDTPLKALKGTLRIVPNANPLAMWTDKRNAPSDNKDLNRAFPGDPDGSHTEKLASIISEVAVDGADVVIDLHGGGSWCINSFVFRFPGGEELAEAFEAHFIVEAPERKITATGFARSKGARVVAVEMGGRSGDEELWAQSIANSTRRALGLAGVLDPFPNGQERSPVSASATEVFTASRRGLLRPALKENSIGRIVPGGTILGWLLEPDTMDLIEEYVAPYPETGILLLRPTLSVVESGEMLYLVAVPESSKG
jgi:predicted deacylase